MRLDGKHRKLLVTAPVTARMAGDLRWVLLADGLPKGVNACHQALVLLVGVRHRLLLPCAVHDTPLGDSCRKDTPHPGAIQARGGALRLALWHNSVHISSMRARRPCTS